MNEAPKISAVDLFCGVGGLTHGLAKANIDVRLGVDIDPAARFPYQHNNDASFLLADVSTLDPAVIKGSFPQDCVTLLAGCAPCQPFSTYAQRARTGGNVEGNPEWFLVERFGELVRDTAPDLVTMENVPPLLKAPVFRRLLEHLDGYSVDAAVIDCQTIGLPQTRKRLVLVASRLGPISLPNFRRKPSTVRETIGHLPSLKAGQCDARDPMHRASSLSPLNMQRIQASKPGGTWRDWPKTLQADCHIRQTGATYPSVYGRMHWDEPSPTITTQCFGYGNGRFGHPEQDRAISLREAAMLQGFPRRYSFLKDGERVSFSKLGRLIGNAVPVTLGRAIGDILVKHVARYRSLTPTQSSPAALTSRRTPRD